MDEQRFQRQLALEDEYQSAGYKKAIHRDLKNKQKSYGSHTTLGNVLRREMVGWLAEVLKDEYNTRILAGKAGKGYVNLFGIFPQRVSWPVVAHIGLSTLLDYVMVPGTPVAYVHRKIGTRIEDELMLRHFRTGDPELFKKCRQDYIRATAGYRQKIYSTAKVFRDAMRDRHKAQLHDEAEAITWHKWPQDTTLAVGAWVVATIQTVFSGLTQPTPEKPGLKLLQTVVIAGKSGHRDYAYSFTDEVKDIESSQQVTVALRASFDDYPMVCPPVDWRGPSEDHPEGAPGGFLTNCVTKRYDLVRRGTSIPSQQAVDALNTLQQVPWRINRFVYEVVKHYYDRGESINESDSFRPYLRPEEHDIPKMPAHLVKIPHPRTATNETDRFHLQKLQEEQKKAKRALRDWHNKEAQRRKESEIFRLVMTCAARFVNEDRFWIPWSFDFRTRMYPISLLNPQSAQYINGMMQFADGHPIDDRTEYWLSIHLATTKGFSKETFEGRVSWVRGNVDEIIAVATDPLGDGRSFWIDADEPWMYLAACREYYELFIVKSKSETHLQCGIDATASGLQILGALMGDESTCHLVNVLPTKKPSDLYQAVMDKCKQLIQDDRPRRRGIPLSDLSRSVAKAPVMTRAYGSTEWTRKGQVWDACNSKRGLDLGLKWEKVEYIAKKLDDAMKLVLPGAEFVLDWLQKTAVLAIETDSSRNEIHWETASGCLVKQRYMVEKLKQATTIALGSTKYFQPKVAHEGEDAKLTKIESSTAANVVHSCDAAVLHLAVPHLGFPISVTHDCGYARAGREMDRLAESLRLAFVQVAKFPVLERFAEINGVPAAIGELEKEKNLEFNPEVALGSQYLFC